MQLPEDFIQQLKQDLPTMASAILEGLSQKPTSSVRLHPYKHTTLFAEEKPIPWYPQAYFLKERPVFTLIPTFHGGAFYVQEAASMILRHFIPEKTLTALDLCAAPGGKTTILLDVLGEKSLVVANEVVRNRNIILCENVNQWGFPNVIITRSQVSDFQKLDFKFDLVLLDAPCSGEGMFRKDPQAIQEWSLRNVEACAKRQKELILQAWALVKPGGRLVYSTCTFNLKENEQIAAHLIENASDTQKVSIPFPKEWNIVENETEQAVIYRCLPGIFEGEGLTIMALDKRGNILEDENSRSLPLKREKHKISFSENWVTEIGKFSITIKKEEVSLFPKSWFFEKEQIELNLSVKQIGLWLGTKKGKDFVPSHYLALSILLHSSVKYIELTEKQALIFLKKEVPEIDGEYSDGWFVVRCDGVALGWMKKLGYQWKNYLPKEYRIRMEIPK